MNFKQSCLTLLCLSFIGSTFANETLCPGEIEIGLKGGWFKNGVIDTDYGRIYSQQVAQKITPKNRFGGGIDFNYYASNLFSVRVTYFGLKTTKNETTTAAITPFLMPGSWGRGLASRDEASFKFQFHFANIECGPVYNLCDTIYIKPKIGLSYFNVKEHLAVLYYYPNSTIIDNVILKSRYSALGPSIGVDLDYYIYNCLSVLCNTRYSAVVGTVYAPYIPTSNDPTVPPRITNFVIKNVLSSAIQMEIGLAYNFTWNCSNKGKISLGYLLTQIDKGKELTTTPTKSSFNGPFLRLAVAY